MYISIRWFSSYIQKNVVYTIAKKLLARGMNKNDETEIIQVSKNGFNPLRSGRYLHAPLLSCKDSYCLERKIGSFKGSLQERRGAWRYLTDLSGLKPFLESFRTKGEEQLTHLESAHIFWLLFWGELTVHTVIVQIHIHIAETVNWMFQRRIGGTFS